MKEITLPSGAILKINLAPFADAKGLYQSLLEELKSVELNSKKEITEVIKDMACLAFSSKKIEAAIWKCFEKCLYNDMKIDKDTFEPMEARGDYMVVCVEVAKENVLPFAKNLYAQYETILAMMQTDPK